MQFCDSRGFPLRINLILAITLAPRHTCLQVSVPQCHATLTRKNTIQRVGVQQKCAAVLATGFPSATVQFIQSVNVAFAYSTASGIIMLKRHGYVRSLVYEGDKFCLRVANGIIFKVIV